MSGKFVTKYTKMQEVIYTTVEDLFDNEFIEKTYSKDDLEYWAAYAQYWERKLSRMADCLIDPIVDPREPEYEGYEDDFARFVELLERFYSNVMVGDLMKNYEISSNYHFLKGVEFMLLESNRIKLYINNKYQPISSILLTKDYNRFLERFATEAKFKPKKHFVVSAKPKPL